MSTEIIRSATFEGMADKEGFPTKAYQNYYARLSKHVKTMITGFIYTSLQGRAMHPGQAGLDTAEKAQAFSAVTNAVHKNGARIIAQIAHVGRQTTDPLAVGGSAKSSPYFGVSPKILTTNEVQAVVQEYIRCAGYAQQAGFDGVQLHCAHGYLIHQFLLKTINNRTDRYADRYLFLREIVSGIRKSCGNAFPIWVKISGAVDFESYSKADFSELVQELNRLAVDCIEVSYGTMDMPLNIFRGGVPLRTVLRHNPVYSKKGVLWKLFGLPVTRMKIKPYQPAYNLAYAKLAQSLTEIPVFCVGGIRSGRQIRELDFPRVSLCRPFIREPDFLDKLAADPDYESKCTNCNICAIMVDTEKTLRCYGGQEE